MPAGRNADGGTRDRVRRIVDASLAPFLPRLERDPPAAIFVIGAPRAGTTLLYQLMVRAFKLAYINNLIGNFPRGGPVLAKWLGCGRWRLPDSFDSSYGRTPGMVGPSEGGRFWHHAIPPGEHHETGPQELDPRNAAYLQRFVAAISEVYRAPFISKNVLNSVRAPLLDRLLPGSAFIVVSRDPVTNASSMLSGRRRSHGDKPGFWSVRPRGLLDKLSMPVPDQVAWQLLLTYRSIDAAREEIGRKSFLDVGYEDLCRRPADTLETIHQFLEGRDILLERRPLPPLRLHASKGPRITPEDEASIRRVLQVQDGPS